MVRIAAVFALAAAAEAARSSAEIDAQLLAANYETAEQNRESKFLTADANFDYEAADALDFDDFDEELAAGDFDFKESALLEESEEQPGMYNWGAAGQNHCNGGQNSVSEHECLAAVQSMLGGQRQGRRHLVSGSWGWVPPGCSAQNGRTHGQRGDNAAHYNRNTNGRNDGGYTPACALHAPGWHAPGWHAPQPGFNGGGIQAGSFMVADGCRRSQGNQQPQVRNSMNGFASVRCCSNNGRRCESTSIGCLQHQTLAQASAACSRRNMRLCSVQELDSGVCCGTGCGFDGHHIWTMTPAGGQQGRFGANGHGININVNGQFNGQHGFSGSAFNGGGRQNQVSEVIAADGCPNRSGRQQARTKSVISGRASVRCCSQDGRRCETQTVGCLENARFTEANAACSQRGLRLCAQQELDRGVCCGTGCGFDGRRVWTSTSAGGFQGSR